MTLTKWDLIDLLNLNLFINLLNSYLSFCSFYSNSFFKICFREIFRCVSQNVLPKLFIRFELKSKFINDFIEFRFKFYSTYLLEYVTFCRRVSWFVWPNPGVAEVWGTGRPTRLSKVLCSTDQQLCMNSVMRNIFLLNHGNSLIKIMKFSN